MLRESHARHRIALGRQLGYSIQIDELVVEVEQRDDSVGVVDLIATQHRVRLLDNFAAHIVVMRM